MKQFCPQILQCGTEALVRRSLQPISMGSMTAWRVRSNGEAASDRYRPGGLSVRYSPYGDAA